MEKDESSKKWRKHQTTQQLKMHISSCIILIFAVVFVIHLLGAFATVNSIHVERDNGNTTPMETTTTDQVEEGEVNHAVDQPVTPRRLSFSERRIACLNACNIVIEYLSAWRACRAHCYYLYGTGGYGRR
ncbi:uncharacterized protein LOC130689618 [Daphnia carinata]|uniref:uncharacterized protein LOC130689618 n=1 Tax=Daphnia carinata TaxID=120202 RepID=UPI002580A75E|nr:uncharacterized protein LOC130689618 [Daphnia carinata]